MLHLQPLFSKMGGSTQTTSSFLENIIPNARESSSVDFDNSGNFHIYRPCPDSPKSTLEMTGAHGLNERNHRNQRISKRTLEEHSFNAIARNPRLPTNEDVNKDFLREYGTKKSVSPVRLPRHGLIPPNRFSEYDAPENSAFAHPFLEKSGRGHILQGTFSGKQDSFEGIGHHQLENDGPVNVKRRRVQNVYNSSPESRRETFWPKNHFTEHYRSERNDICQRADAYLLDTEGTANGRIVNSNDSVGLHDGRKCENSESLPFVLQGPRRVLRQQLLCGKPDVSRPNCSNPMLTSAEYDKRSLFQDVNGPPHLHQSIRTPASYVDSCDDNSVVNAYGNRPGNFVFEVPACNVEEDNSKYELIQPPTEACPNEDGIDDIVSLYDIDESNNKRNGAERTILCPNYGQDGVMHDGMKANIRISKLFNNGTELIAGQPGICHRHIDVDRPHRTTMGKTSESDEEKDITSSALAIYDKESSLPNLNMEVWSNSCPTVEVHQNMLALQKDGKVFLTREVAIVETIEIPGPSLNNNKISEV